MSERLNAPSEISETESFHKGYLAALEDMKTIIEFRLTHMFDKPKMAAPCPPRSFEAMGEKG